MKIKVDRITTIVGVAAGTATAVAQSGMVDPKTSGILGTVGGLSIAILGYFTNKQDKP